MAQLNAPFPPGDYPIVVIGSGPGALQLSYSLSRLRIDHAVLSQDGTPGGMFQRFPIFQRLISWTKPYAPAARGTRAYERFDWNSLLAGEPEVAAIMPEVMDGSSYFPTRSEMEKGIGTFADRARVRVRYGCRWESTRLADGGFALTTTDGEYRCRLVVFAVGMARPWKPMIPGIDAVPHYADIGAARDFADARVFIIGKRNSGFELANGFLPWARQILLGSPSPAKLSVVTRSLVGARARYLQPYEDHVLGGGNVIMDVAIEGIERTAAGFLVRAKGTTLPGDYVFDVDRVVAATGFEVPMQDLRSLGVSTIMQDRLPAQTPLWESVTVPGMYFTGTVTQGATELKKYGIPSSSAAVHGFRYNSVILARHIAAKHFGMEVEGRALKQHEVVDHLLSEASENPALWSQRSYLACAVEFDPQAGITDAGVVPLAHFVDAPGPEAVAVTIETDASGDIHPAVYIKAGARVEELLLPSTQMHDYRTPEHRNMLVDRLGSLLR
jgi:thioredoxin reductase